MNKILLQALLEDARAGKPVYITTVHHVFDGLHHAESERIVCVVELMDQDGRTAYELRIPSLERCDAEAQAFVRDYVQAEIYNILSSVGGRCLTLYLDTGKPALLALARGLDDAFCIDSSRRARVGYGRSVNVIDRMIAAVRPGEPSFRFLIVDLKQLPALPAGKRPSVNTMAFFRACTSKLEGKAFAGIDVGGTDIKAVLVVDGMIVDYKEYDWFPANFTRSVQLIDPICLIARLLQARLAIHRLPVAAQLTYLPIIVRAMDKDASDAAMENVLRELTRAGLAGDARLDAIGLCFPDVVVKNKIVGGEVYKTRGIRNNPEIDYDADFAQLTHLDDRLRASVVLGGAVRIINDGPMASFTAAVEMAFSGEADKVRDGVFAHTLGTELGTGWITESGDIPDIPLEVYNFIIDLGSWPERAFEPDDLRSVNNFNTGLPGTLQKYCSQSGIFRLALKYFPSERPDLFAELQEKGYVVSQSPSGKSGYYVPTEPVDQRKPFLEHMMRLPDREKDETNAKIWREIGEALAVTLLESKRILDPGTDERFLFGRLVKNQTCFDLMVEGARRIKPDIALLVAGTGMAYTPLMKQLESHPHFTVAQFAQAIGAVYYANS
ncbi:MAG: hypothetical protein QM739_01000 [Propionivibrio sp.]